MNMIKHQEEVMTFLQKKFQEMNTEAGYPISGGVIGTSVDDSLSFDHIPEDRPAELAGFFMDRTASVHVEVVSYSPMNGMVVVNATYPDGGVMEPKLTQLHYDIFSMIFHPVASLS